MKYIATRYENHGEFSEEFEAESMEGAEEHCRQNGWLLDGELVDTVLFGVNHPMPSMGIH